MRLLHGEENPAALYCIPILFLLCSCLFAQVSPGQILVLVNQNSPASRYIAKLYKQYHPEIPDSHFLYLRDDPNFPDLHLSDCSGPESTPADEIITRDEYEKLIARRVRSYLVQNNRVNSIYVILTTAGLPYRIADSTYTNIVLPAGGTAYSASYAASIDAASVESELAVLFQNDPNNPFSVGPFDRVVNPYQGYRRSGIELFERDILNNLNNLDWHKPRKMYASHYPPWMEGDRARNDGVQIRHFSAGDMYLTCRLDGPKQQGKTAIESVHNMLERAKRASNPAFGINPQEAVIILDDAPLAMDYNFNRIYNLNKNVFYLIWQPIIQQPPDTIYAEIRDDFYSGYFQMTGQYAMEEVFNTAPMPAAYDLSVICDKQISCRVNQLSLPAGKLVTGLCGFGTNGDEGSNKYYLLTGGPGAGPLFNLTNGAVFCSIESFNAVTMFSNASSYQAKIVDFISIGGTAAIGHSFEPIADATIDTEFLFYNLMADYDSDGYADMTFIEAAFTAIPYISWTEVVIGDPLMRIAYGLGGEAQNIEPGDIDGSGKVDIADVYAWMNFYLGALNSDQQITFEGYHDLCDLNSDGNINFSDFAAFFESY